MEKRSKKILLISPPFRWDFYPNLGLSILKSNLEKGGFDAKVYYANLKFSKQIGPSIYFIISNYAGGLNDNLEEFIFSFIYYQRDSVYIEKFITDCYQNNNIQFLYSYLFPILNKKKKIKAICGFIEYLINEAKLFIDRTVSEILLEDYLFVGFSAMMKTNFAILTLMKELKRRKTDIITIMGGPNCYKEMGEALYKNFHEIDYIAQGECDLSIVEFAGCIYNNIKPIIIPGILTRESSNYTEPLSLSQKELDESPYPNFDDYFKELENLGLKDKLIKKLLLLAQTSRGCWKGQIEHCMFCALNQHGLNYRSKSPERAYDEIVYLTNKYNIHEFYLTDAIFDYKYFKTFIPKLIQKPSGASLHYEIQPFLSKYQIQLLKKANISGINPGIESLSTESLKLMKKNSTQLKNIQTLKLSMTNGIHLIWSHLYGFPGESGENIEKVNLLISKLHHLTPPDASILKLHRFSPYFNRSDEFGFTPLTVHKIYYYIYDISEESLNKIVPNFESSVLNSIDELKQYKELKKSIRIWNKKFKFSHLIFFVKKGNIIIIDTRECRKKQKYKFSGIEKDIYKLCDSAISIKSIKVKLDYEIDEEKIKSILNSFIEKNLLIEENGLYLSLANEFSNDYRNYTEFFHLSMPRMIMNLLKNIRKFKVSIPDIILSAFLVLCFIFLQKISNIFARLYLKVLLLIYL